MNFNNSRNKYKINKIKYYIQTYHKKYLNIYKYKIKKSMIIKIYLIMINKLMDNILNFHNINKMLKTLLQVQRFVKKDKIFYNGIYKQQNNCNISY